MIGITQYIPYLVCIINLRCINPGKLVKRYLFIYFYWCYWYSEEIGIFVELHKTSACLVGQNLTELAIDILKKE